MLRPLGTIIVVTIPPSMTSTDSRYSIVKYRVVDYATFVNMDWTEEKGEVLETISVKKILPKSFTFEVRMVPKVVEVCNYI